jgi:hypothetical protein
MRSLRSLATLGLLAGLAGCSTTEPAGNDLLLNMTVASVSGEAAAQHVEMMRGPGGPLGFGFRADAGTFECTGGGRDGLTVTRTCTFKDAAGATQAAYDATTTATVRLEAVVKGTLDRGHMSGTIERVSDLTVTGLEGSEASVTWKGNASGSITRVRTADGGTMQMNMTEQETITDVVIPVPRTENSWPKSGTITRQVAVSFQGGPKDGTTEQRDVKIAFNGTQFATITVNGDTFQFDLAARGRAGHGGGPGGRP